MDVQVALRLASEAADTLENAEAIYRTWSRGERWKYEGIDDEWIAARQAAFGAIAVAARLASMVPGAPEPAEFEWEAEYGNFDGPLRATLRLKALLVNQQDLDRVARSSVPSLSVESLHRWVWDAASSFWADKHHRAAVHAAAAQVELHLQAKLGRHDVSGAALLRQAFSLDQPQPGKPRLRFLAFAEGSERYKSIHEGAVAFGAGLAQAFRNTAAHDPLRPLSEDVALEQLSAFSLLARIVDSATVQRHAEDGP